MKRTKQYVDKKVEKLHQELSKNGRKTLVLGISGGVDSAVTLGILNELAKKYPGYGYKIIAVVAPIFDSIGTTEQNEAYNLAMQVISHFNYTTNIITDTKFFDLGNISNTVNKELSIFDNTYIQQQVDYWLRPMAFYRIAMEYDNSILISTTNYSEWKLGWFSQYLDIFGIHPIIDLYKSQVYKLADYFNIPYAIIKTPAKGGLASGESDEDALGFTYAAFENINNTKNEVISNRIIESEFKRNRFNKDFIFATHVEY